MDSETSDQSALQLALGTQYQLEREIGRGGMATVYLARDIRHRREVAVKVLHAELSAALGSERFLREIELTASLQHPHILPLFDSGATAGLLYYVMPYVQGESLRAKLDRERQLPVADTVRIATQVGDALEYAHRHGVVHRDIKPENVLLHDDHALVADFGIALAVWQAGGPRLTLTGLSLGTPHYMSPEQAMGERAVDARTDVYALAAMTYEMLAGEPPFTGPSAQAVVARVISEAPRSLMLQRPTVPLHVDAAVRAGLAKLPADRTASAAAFVTALASPSSTTASASDNVAAPNAGRDARSRGRATALMATGALAAIAFAFVAGRRSASRSMPLLDASIVRYTIEPDSGRIPVGAPAIAPDGRTIVYAQEGPDGVRLFARRLDELTSRPLEGTEDGGAPFFSPDGAWVGFFSHGAIRKVRVDGGAPVVVTSLPNASVFWGAAWGPGDTVFFAAHPGTLHRVPANGGAAVRLPVADTALRFSNPQLLPGGKSLIATVTENYVPRRTDILDLATGRLRQLVQGAHARYAAGQLIFVHPGGGLYRQPFDLERLALTGVAERLEAGLGSVAISGFDFDVSRAGSMVYREGGPESRKSWKLMLMDRAGHEQRIVSTRAPWTPRFSPDGRRVAYAALAPGSDEADVWITDVRSGLAQRVTVGGNDNTDPQWSPDGNSIAFSGPAPGGKDMYLQHLAGGPSRLLVRRPGDQWPTDWVGGTNTVLFTDVSPSGELDVWIQPTDGGVARPYLSAPGRQAGARASPDGRWVAYTSDETGRNEVYMQSYPVPAMKLPVSADGGSSPVWRGDGRQLYYWRGDQLMAVTLDVDDRGGPPIVRDRTALFRAPFIQFVNANYDVSPDGEKFIVVTGEGGARLARLAVALHALGQGAATSNQTR